MLMFSPQMPFEQPSAVLYWKPMSQHPWYFAKTNLFPFHAYSLTIWSIPLMMPFYTYIVCFQRSILQFGVSTCPTSLKVDCFHFLVVAGQFEIKPRIFTVSFVGLLDLILTSCLSPKAAGADQGWMCWNCQIESAAGLSDVGIGWLLGFSPQFMS